MLRDGGEQTFDVGTVAMRGEDIDRLLLWAGAVLHAPHRAMSIQRSIPPEGVFVAYFAYGSPATRYKLFAGRRIVAVDGLRLCGPLHEHVVEGVSTFAVLGLCSYGILLQSLHCSCLGCDSLGRGVRITDLIPLLDGRLVSAVTIPGLDPIAEAFRRK